jgi:hypothetical protein
MIVFMCFDIEKHASNLVDVESRIVECSDDDDIARKRSNSVENCRYSGCIASCRSFAFSFAGLF